MTYCNKSIMSPQCDDSNCNKCYNTNNMNDITNDNWEKRFDETFEFYLPENREKLKEFVANQIYQAKISLAVEIAERIKKHQFRNSGIDSETSRSDAFYCGRDGALIIVESYI